MSFQVGFTCYPTAIAANQVTASSENGSVVQRGNETYVVTLGDITSNSITYIYRSTTTNLLGMPTTVSQTFNSNPIPCGLLDTADAILLGSAILVAWVATAAVNVLRRGVHE